MNKRKRNARHLHHPFHFNYLFFLPLFIIIFGAFFLWSVNKALQDQRFYADWLRDLTNEQIRTSIVFYKVEQGDTIESIAQKFDISVETIVWANDLPPEGISPDMIVTILPVDGVVHTVKNLETIENIAPLYGVSPDVIRNYPHNEFSSDPVLPITIGQTLIVPGGRKDGMILKGFDVLGVWDRVRRVLNLRRGLDDN